MALLATAFYIKQQIIEIDLFGVRNRFWFKAAATECPPYLLQQCGLGGFLDFFRLCTGLSCFSQCCRLGDLISCTLVARTWNLRHKYILIWLLLSIIHLFEIEKK